MCVFGWGARAENPVVRLGYSVGVPEFAIDYIVRIPELLVVCAAGLAVGDRKLDFRWRGDHDSGFRAGFDSTGLLADEKLVPILAALFVSRHQRWDQQINIPRG